MKFLNVILTSIIFHHFSIIPILFHIFSFILRVEEFNVDKAGAKVLMYTAKIPYLTTQSSKMEVIPKVIFMALFFSCHHSKGKFRP